MPLEELIFHVNICTTSWYPLKVGIVFGFLFLVYSAWSAREDALFWKCVSLGKEGKQGWWNRVCLWLPLCWGPMVSYACHHVCHHGNWFPRASAWSWFGLVLKSPCSFAVWRAVIHVVEAVLLWLTWEDSRCKADPGSATACGSCEVPGRVLPERVICPHRPFSFQSDTTTVRSSRTTLAHQSLQLPPSDSSWAYLFLGVESLGVKINVGSPTGNGQLDYSRQYVTGTHAAWQERSQSTSNACGVPGHLQKDGRGRHPAHVAIAGPPRDKANASVEKGKLFRLGFLNLLKPCCNLGYSWFLMDVSTCHKFLVQ